MIQKDFNEVIIRQTQHQRDKICDAENLGAADQPERGVVL